MCELMEGKTMDRTATIQDLAEAMGLQVKRSDYKSQYDMSTGTYYCDGRKKPERQNMLMRLA